MKLLHEDVERFGQARFENVLAFHDAFVHARSSRHVVGFDGEELLQRVGSAVRFDRPDFHLPETLTTELGFSAERLLRNERIGSDRPCVDLLFDQVVKFQHVHHADRDRVLERLARTSVEQDHLSVLGNLCALEQLFHVGLASAVEHRSAQVNACGHACDHLLHRRVVGFVDDRVDVAVFERVLQSLTRFFSTEHRELSFQLVTQVASGPAQVDFEDLTNVHPRRDAERVQDHVDRRTIRQVRHVFRRENFRDDTFVTVAAGELVTDLELTFDRDVNFDHLDDARGKLVTFFEAIELLAEDHFDGVELVTSTVDHASDLVFEIRLERDVVQELERNRFEIRVRDELALREELLRSVFVQEDARRRFADEDRLEFRESVVADDVLFDRQILLELATLLFDDRLETFVAVRTFAAVDLRIDDRTRDTRRNTQRRVADVAGFFTEDRAEKFFFRGELRFALGSDFTDEDVARFHFRADANDTAGVEVLEGLFADVRDIARDLFFTEFRVAGDAFELFDVDRSVRVFFDQALGDEDRVLEVVAHPRRERDEDVLTESELTELRRRSVSDDVRLANGVTDVNDRLLVEARVLVRTLILREVVDVDVRAELPAFCKATDHDTACVYFFDHAVVLSDDRRSRVTRDQAFDARSDERSSRTEKRNGLTLHVRAHECAVGVIVLEERDQRCRDRDELRGRNVHQRHFFAIDDFVFTVDTANHVVDGDLRSRDEVTTRRSDVVTRLFESGGVRDFRRNRARIDFAIRSFDEAVVVDTSVSRERRDETDVRSFRRFDRADTAVMGRVNVADFEACAVTSQTTGSERRETTFVRDLGERVRLIHELRQL